MKIEESKIVDKKDVGEYIGEACSSRRQIASVRHIEGGETIVKLKPLEEKMSDLVKCKSCDVMHEECVVFDNGYYCEDCTCEDCGEVLDFTRHLCEDCEEKQNKE
jgi:hypothetical protein